jgi:hypothetical protein
MRSGFSAGLAGRLFEAMGRTIEVLRVSIVNLTPHGRRNRTPASAVAAGVDEGVCARRIDVARTSPSSNDESYSDAELT